MDTMQALSTEALRDRLMAVSKTSALRAMGGVPLVLDVLARDVALFRDGKVSGPLDVSRSFDDCAYQVRAAAELGLLHAHISGDEHSALMAQMQSITTRARLEIAAWLAEQAIATEMTNAEVSDQGRGSLFSELDAVQSELRRAFVQMRPVAAKGEANVAHAQARQ